MSETGFTAAAGDVTVPRAVTPDSGGRPEPDYFLAVVTLWRREIQGFYRQKARIAAGVATPLIFWLVLGSGFGRSLGSAGGASNYLDFFFPGAVTLVVLFASLFSNISIIEDRREGFMLSVLAAPVPRSALVLGKTLGATTIGALQGALFLPLIPMLESPIAWNSLPTAGAAVFLMAFGLTNLGFFFAWRLNSMQGFHAVMNMLLMPMWLLSGGLFPIEGAAGWIVWLMRVNPLAYGVSALRSALFEGQPALPGAWAVLAGFGLVSWIFAAREASRPSAANLS